MNPFRFISDWIDRSGRQKAENRTDAFLRDEIQPRKVQLDRRERELGLAGNPIERSLLGQRPPRKKTDR